jgi:predicted Zn-dependent peptidase
LVFRELEKLRKTALGTTQLHLAKMQLIGQMAINNDQALNEMQSIGKSYLVYDRVDTMEEISTEINSITPLQVLEAANEILLPDRFSRLYYN